MNRQVYVRITNEKGKREYRKIGFLHKDGTVILYDGMPLTGWFDV